MVQEARELEAFLRGIEGQEALAKEAGDLAGRLEAAGIPRITKKAPQIEIQKVSELKPLPSELCQKKPLEKRLGKGILG